MFNYNYKTTDTYTTEQELFSFLTQFLNFEIIHDKVVPNSNIRNRPDFRIEELKLIIEFNGKFHYTTPEGFITDKKKRDIYEKMGYTVKELPYFIQLDKNTIKWLFSEFDLDNTKIKDYTSYKHGFVDKTVPLPSSFCELGLNRYSREVYSQFEYALCDIDTSLYNKISEYDSIAKVLSFKEFYVEICSMLFMYDFMPSNKIYNEFFELKDLYRINHTYFDFKYCTSIPYCDGNISTVANELLKIEDVQNITEEKIDEKINSLINSTTFSCVPDCLLS